MAKFIDFFKKDIYKNTHPVSCTVNDEKITMEEKTWSSLLTAFTNYCLKKERQIFDNLGDKPIYGKKPFLYNRDRHYGSYHQLSNGKFILTSYDVKLILRIISNLCSLCSINIDKVIISYSPGKVCKKEVVTKQEKQIDTISIIDKFLAQDKKTAKLFPPIVSNIDFLFAERYKNIYPVACTINSDIISIEENTWASLLKSITNYCLKKNSQIFDELDNKSIYKDKPFLYDRDRHYGSYHQLSNGKFILTSYSCSEILVTIKNLSSICSIDIKNVIVSYSPGKAHKKKKEIEASLKQTNKKHSLYDKSKEKIKAKKISHTEIDPVIVNKELVITDEQLSSSIKYNKVIKNQNQIQKSNKSQTDESIEIKTVVDPKPTIKPPNKHTEKLAETKRGIPSQNYYQSIYYSKEIIKDNKPQLKPKSNDISKYHHSVVFHVPKDENALQKDDDTDSIDAYIGVDIGTKYSKVFIKITNGTDVNYKIPLKHRFADNEVFFPTEIFIANRQLYFWEEDLPKNTKSVKFDYLKLRFAEDKNYEVLFIAYIVKIITEAKNFAFRFKETKNIKYFTLDFEIAVTYPETLLSNKSGASFKHFERVIATVDSIINSHSGKSISLIEIEKLSYKVKYNTDDDKVGIGIYTEAKSEMISFISSIRDYGQIILIDIGEGTTELSGCWVERTDKIIVSVWASVVLKEGVYKYKIDSTSYKRNLKSNLQSMLESDNKAHLDETRENEFDNANTIFISGGGCTIRDITDSLRTLTVRGKEKIPKIVTMDKDKRASSIANHYHRFLVTMGSIELLENDYKYKVIDYYEYLKDKERKEQAKKKVPKKTYKEKMDEKRRVNGL